MIVPIQPVPKPRMTQRDRWAKRPAVVRYHAFCDGLREAVPSGFQPEEKLTLRFYLAMPPSWSKRKRGAFVGKPHQQRPDIDNLVKSFLDALCSDDSYVYAIRAEKYWSEQGYIEVEDY